jgi:hypothetical protein
MRMTKLAITLLIFTSPARADQCTYGDIKAIFNSLQVIFSRQVAPGKNTHMARAVYAPLGGPCQYRLWAGPELGSDETPPIQTFSAGQFFIGGAGENFDYPNFGLSRAQAQMDLELIEDHVYIMQTDDAWNYDANLLITQANEQTVLRSPYRQENFNGAGLTLSQNRDVIDQLPAGRYVSLFIESYPGDPVLQAIHPDDPDWVSYFSAYEFSSVIYLDIVP